MKRALNQEVPTSFFLVETKISSDTIYCLKHELGYSKGIAVSSDGLSKGLALLWKPDSRVEVRMATHWHSDAFVEPKSNGDRWRLTGF